MYLHLLAVVPIPPHEAIGLFIDCGENILNCIVKKVYAVLYIQYMYQTLYQNLCQ